MILHHQYAEQLSSLGSYVVPSPLDNMQVELFNHELARQIGFPINDISPDQLLAMLHSPSTPFTFKAFAQKYGGHQFGHWNPELGDGRGLLLGELKNEQGHYTDLHLKGAGPTPYSRHADGRAVLRSTIREYIGGEALHALGIPSSRSLCLFSSSTQVLRETAEPGAMMIRTAPSHIRFGHFEYYFYAQQHDKLEQLMDYTIANHFSECANANNPYAELLRQITLRTARMIALWQCHGFVHGVMNTDNMSIHGITFDYGPYAFMDYYDSNAVFNHTDQGGRYAYDQQPGIALWNLNALAHAFSSHCSIDELKDILSQFEPTYMAQYNSKMLSRMGLESTPEHKSCLTTWLDILASEQRDYTYSFRQLALCDGINLSDSLRDNFIDRRRFDNWWNHYSALRQHISSQSTDLMQLNPAVIPRTHLLQDAIESAELGDFSKTTTLLEATSTPYDKKWDNHDLSKPPATTSAVSLSCSS